jgi:hypothetical protein
VGTARATRSNFKQTNFSNHRLSSLAKRIAASSVSWIKNIGPPRQPSFFGMGKEEVGFEMSPVRFLSPIAFVWSRSGAHGKLKSLSLLMVRAQVVPPAE